MRLFPQSTHSESTHLPDGNTNGGVGSAADREKEAGVYDDDSPVKFLSMRSLAMGVLVSMGGFIFGYDTGMSPERTPAGTVRLNTTSQVRFLAFCRCMIFSNVLARAMALAHSVISGLA